ncbi:hypothetical protein LXL04_028404 [Taraxacum kok-saghyz]
MTLRSFDHQQTGNRIQFICCSKPQVMNKPHQNLELYVVKPKGVKVKRISQKMVVVDRWRQRAVATAMAAEILV